MSINDTLGNVTSGASGKSLAAYELVRHKFQCYIGDPVATVDEASVESPGLVMGHALRVYLHLLGTEPGGIPIGRDSHAKAPL